MKTIIVPTDFSEISINAIYYAIELALIIKADILLLHVITLPVTIEVQFPSKNISIMEKEATQRLEILLDKIIKPSKSSISISIKVSVGSFLEEIKNHLVHIDTFAIIIGIKGAGATQRILFGSNVFTLIEELTTPVIIVADEVTFTPLKNIGIAIDLKSIIGTIPLNMISAIMNLFNSSLHILFVSQHKEVSSGEILQYSSLQNELAKYQPKFHHIISENIEEGIFEFLKKEEIDLLMVFPKKHGIVDAILNKSISKDLVINCRVPVMTFH